MLSKHGFEDGRCHQKSFNLGVPKTNLLVFEIVAHRGAILQQGVLDLDVVPFLFAGNLQMGITEFPDMGAGLVFKGCNGANEFVSQEEFGKIMPNR